MIRHDTGSPMAPTGRAALPGEKRVGADSATKNAEDSENVWLGYNESEHATPTPVQHVTTRPSHTSWVSIGGSATANAEENQ